MSSPIKEAFHKVHEAVWVIATVACLLLVKEWTKATVLEIVAAAGILLILLVIYHVIDAWRGWKLQQVFPWLYSASQEGPGRRLYEVEVAVRPRSTVFLVSPDLDNDARNQTTIDAVETNLKRGVRYVYVTRDDDGRSAANIDAVMRNFAGFGSQVSLIVANDVFVALPTYNILILEHDAEDRRRVFIELPVYTPEAGRASRRLWAEADETLAETWHQKLLGWLKARDSISNPYAVRPVQTEPIVPPTPASDA